MSIVVVLKRLRYRVGNLPAKPYLRNDGSSRCVFANSSPAIVYPANTVKSSHRSRLEMSEEVQ
jgi:hypothetical protein